MPLKRGIIEFRERGFNIEKKLLINIFDNKQHFTDLFRRQPKLLNSPYAYIKFKGKTTINKTLLMENPIYGSIVHAGLVKFGKIALIRNNYWNFVGTRHFLFDDENDRISFLEGHALIDSVIYVIFLANIYVSSKNVFDGLNLKHRVEDIFGTLNLSAVEKSFTRYLKSISDNSHNPHLFIFASDLAIISNNEIIIPRLRSSMNKGLEFEEQCTKICIDAGFSVRTTSLSGDFGADIIAFKEGLSFVIQCKNTSKPAGIRAVQEVIGSMRHYLADYAVVCSSGGFTSAALELAMSNAVIVCNADSLGRELSR